jgi:hypothetical protein
MFPPWRSTWDEDCLLQWLLHVIMLVEITLCCYICRDLPKYHFIIQHPSLPSFTPKWLRCQSPIQCSFLLFQYFYAGAAKQTWKYVTLPETPVSLSCYSIFHICLCLGKANCLISYWLMHAFFRRRLSMVARSRRSKRPRLWARR